MARIKSSDDLRERRAVIKVIGVGGAGGNAINRMVEVGLRDVELIAANTDAQVLRDNKAPVRIQLGERVTSGLGVGGNPEKGRLAGMESRDQLREVLAGADLVFITAGMGGGTGTGVAPVAAQTAKELNALTIGVVTRPFEFEGTLRASRAEQGIKEMRGCVDTLLVIPNDRLFGVTDQNTTSEEAFRKADEVLRQAIQSISEVITTAGLINVDLNDIRAIMTDPGEALLGVGEAEGPNRAIEAARQAVSSPLLENVSIDGARGLLVNFVGSRRMTLVEIREAMDSIKRSASPEANIKCGAAFDDSLAKRLRVTVIATGFPPRRSRGGAALPRGRRLGGLLAPRRDYVPAAAGGAEGPSSTPEEWAKPAFLRWKLRKLR